MSLDPTALDEAVSRLMVITRFTFDMWATYANALQSYHDNQGSQGDSNYKYGTCRYCFSLFEVPAYDMFSSLQDYSPAARELGALYASGDVGRSAERVRLAGRLAEYIRKEVLSVY